ncbi:MAG: AI-2E family transporter [Aeromicrobium sp.]|uniref:AI-2E family transporter n=1 Tax=Aeromicrobium sp. TaxID=1871063 RepID=UPI003C3F4C4C
MSERYEVPPGVEAATQWAWRLIVLAVAGLGLLWLLRFFSEITVPIAIAMLGTALTINAVDWLQAKGIPRLAATFIVVLSLLVLFFGMLTLVGQQFSTQFTDLRANVVEGITQVQDWAKDPPLNLSDNQIQSYIDSAKQTISASDTALLSTVGSVGTTVTHVLAGFFIALFAAFFFLYEGQRIWSWIVAIFPRSARPKIDSSGHNAWNTLTQFVRATVLVALVDALGIAIAAWVLGVPLSFAIGVLVFLGAFVPIIGALVSGMVAVLVALVAQGPVVALFMLIAVVVVQQIESHVLQPFLMGRFVSVHPLAIILAIAGGIAVAGVIGALIAVPLAATLNGVVRHLVDTAQEYQDDPEDDVDVESEPA